MVVHDTECPYWDHELFKKTNSNSRKCLNSQFVCLFSSSFLVYFHLYFLQFSQKIIDRPVMYSS